MDNYKGGIIMAVIISANGNTIYTITDDMIMAMQYSMSKSTIQNAILSIIQSDIDSYINKAKQNLSDAWLPLIRARYDTMPTKDADLGKLIFSQPDYLDYDGRNK